MTSTPTAQRIGTSIIEAARRDRAWRKGFTRPLPPWFKGAHLAGLSEHERRARFDDMARRAVLHRGWALAAILAVGAIVMIAFWLPRFSLSAVVFWPGTLLLLGRHDTLRRQFKRDAAAFETREHRS